MRREHFDAVVELAREHDLVLFGDEVYRELEHDPADRLPAVMRGLRARRLARQHLQELRPARACGSAGSPPATRRCARRCADLKDYTTICASAPSELLTALALRHRDVLLDRNLAIVERNLPLLDDVLRAARRRARLGAPDRRPDRVPARDRARRRRPVVRAARRGRRAAASPARSRPAAARPGRVRASEPPGRAGGARACAHGSRPRQRSDVNAAPPSSSRPTAAKPALTSRFSFLVPIREPSVL